MFRSIKLIAMIIIVTMVTGYAASCSKPEEEKEAVVNTLVNHMTDTEIEKSGRTDLMLLDHPWESEGAGGEYDYLEDVIGYELWQPEDFLEELERCREYYEDDEYEMYIRDIEEYPEYYTDQVNGFIVNGTVYFFLDFDADYDGGAGEATFIHCNATTWEPYSNYLEFNSYDEFKTLLQEEFDICEETGEFSSGKVAKMQEDTLSFFDALIDGDVSVFDYGTLAGYDDYCYNNETGNTSGAWEFDDDEVASVSEYITEYHFYDEELDLNFIVHVTTPPEYDADTSYGALVMTDAVWRFGDVVNLRQEMEEGRAEDKLLITIGQDYTLDNTDNDIRSNIFCDHKKEFLDFITDNLMPYLYEIYKIDPSSSCLFGHSQGGVFTHYAAFNFDLYENQPFAEYIIGSPAFWTPYFTCVSDYEEYKDEYGYFERNETYDKFLVITGGDKEDADYEEYYGDNDSTLEGITHLCERLDSHGVTTYVTKLYDSNHYMYVPTLLMEYVDNTH